MARLTAKARSKIPGKDFAGPGRSFPIEERRDGAQCEPDPAPRRAVALPAVY